MKLFVSRSVVDKLAAVLLTGTLFTFSVVLPQSLAEAHVSVLGPTHSPIPTPLPAPTITHIDPAVGPTHREVHVTILGTNFVKKPSVRIGRTELDDVVFVSSSQLRATVPPEIMPGTYSVRVCNPDRQCAELPAAYTVSANPSPTLLRIEPNKGFNDIPNPVVISGRDLQPGVQITIGNVRLQNIAWIRSTKVWAVVPAGLPVGTYAVIARNPGAPGTSVLEHAYTVLNSMDSDFFAREDDLWTTPESIRSGNIVKLSLKVHRKGGKDAVQVDVAFYLGDPDHGGKLLGDKLSAPMLPGSDAQTVSFAWNTVGVSVTSPVLIYAIIDPNNLIHETNEQNNRVVRRIRFLPPESGHDK